MIHIDDATVVGPIIAKKSAKSPYVFTLTKINVKRQVGTALVGHVNPDVANIVRFEREGGVGNHSNTSIMRVDKSVTSGRDERGIEAI